MHAREQFAVFVPSYNEREKIGDVLARVIECAGRRLGMLVVADDGSTDGSDLIARRYTPHVIALPGNGGNGTATRAALSYLAALRGSPWLGVVRIDGDGQHEPALLANVFDLIEGGNDAVVCSRFHPKSDVRHVPPDRLELNVSAASRVRGVVGWPVTDARSGFLGFRWDLLRPIIGSLQTERYGIPMELLLRFWHRHPGARYAELPHPAMYQPGISARLDRKYREETRAEKVRRRHDAHQIFEATCRSLGIPFE